MGKIAVTDGILVEKQNGPPIFAGSLTVLYPGPAVVSPVTTKWSSGLLLWPGLTTGTISGKAAMTIDNLIQEMQDLKTLEATFLAGKLEKKHDYWNKVTTIQQLLVKVPELKAADYEKYKAEVEASVATIKTFQAERERRYIAMKEQMHYNQVQIEKELEPLEVSFRTFQEDPSQKPDIDYFNTINRLAKRIQTVRPLENEVRESLTARVTTILSTLDEQRQAAREQRIQESEAVRSAVQAKIDAAMLALTSAPDERKQTAYDEFFAIMEALKSELDSETMVKKHVDSLWKYWKKVKEDAKDLLTTLYTTNYEQLTADIDAFVARLETIDNPKEAVNQYKAIQKKAIAAVIKRRQKDKVFKRFKEIWTTIQTRFESHYQEMEAQRKYRDEQRQKEQERRSSEKDRQSDQLREQLAIHEEAVVRLKADIKVSKSETFIRKAEEVLMVQERMIAEIQKKLSRVGTSEDKPSRK